MKKMAALLAAMMFSLSLFGCEALDTTLPPQETQEQTAQTKSEKNTAKPQRALEQIYSQLGKRIGLVEEPTAEQIAAVVGLDAKDYEQAYVRYVETDFGADDVYIVLPKEGRRAKVQMMRLSYNDYSIFCLAASRVKENWIIAAGVFPGRAKLAEKTMSEMRDTPVTRGRAAELARRITAEYRFGTNYRGTAEYRRTLCEVFARRAIEELADEDSCKM